MKIKTSQDEIDYLKDVICELVKAIKDLFRIIGICLPFLHPKVFKNINKAIKKAERKY